MLFFQRKFIDFLDSVCLRVCSYVRKKFYFLYGVWLNAQIDLSTSEVGNPERVKVQWELISGDRICQEFEYKDETWNEIAYLNERRAVLACKGKFFPMPDNICNNTRVCFSGKSFKVESREKNANRWVMLKGKYQQGSIFAVEYDFCVESDFTEIQFGFNYRNIAERARLMVVDNRQVVFQVVERGGFIYPTKHLPWRFEHGKHYRVRIEIIENIFSYFVDGACILSVRVPSFLMAQKDCPFALIFWEAGTHRPILASVDDFRVFRGVYCG